MTAESAYPQVPVATGTSVLPAEHVIPQISLREALPTWGKISLLSFGGPAAQIAVMHRLIVDEKKWLDERRFLHALNFCMLLPGPEAQQLATYIGWLMHGIRGGLAAGLIFILPGFVAMLALSYAYVSLQESFAFQSFFFGMKCAVLSIVAEAVIRVSRRVLRNRSIAVVSAAAFLLLWFRLLPFPAVIGLAAFTGMLVHRLVPGLWGSASPESGSAQTSGNAEYQGEVKSQWARSAAISVISLTLWFGLIAIVAGVTGTGSVYTMTAIFFSKAAVVTFGGAYAVLSYVDQQAVDTYGWINKGEMADGLGLAETTPGPLIMVVQFVGFLAAWRHGHSEWPLLAGTAGAVITTWVTFVPCFFWIFLGAPFIERMLHKRWLSTSLTAITAAVVGVITTLSVNLTVATLFAEQVRIPVAWGLVTIPDWSTIRLDACAVTVLGGLLLLVFHRGMTVTLTACIVAGFLLRMIVQS